MWPAQRGLGRSLWLQAAQEKDAKKAMTLRESAVANYRESLTTIETLRQGSLRADESRTTFLATIKDVFDEAASAYASLALLTNPFAGAPLSGKSLEYAGEAFRINEQSRARSLLDLLNETNAAITEGVAELLKRKQENFDRQQDIADILTGINISSEEMKKKPAELDAELEQLQAEYEIENQIRTASPRYATLTANKPLTLAEVQQNVLDDQTVLVEYALQAEESYLFAASKGAVSLFCCPRVECRLATDLRAQLIPTKLQRRIVGIDVAEANRGFGIASSAPEDAAGFIAASNALYKAVLEPAAGMIGEKRLMVVADGALNYIPFEVLLKSADAGDFSSLGYLVKTNEVIYAPSASVVGVKQQRESHRPRDADHRRSGIQFERRAREEGRGRSCDWRRGSSRPRNSGRAYRRWRHDDTRRRGCSDGRTPARSVERHTPRSRPDLEARESVRRSSRRLARSRRERRQRRDARRKPVHHPRRHAWLIERRAAAVYGRSPFTRRQ